MIHSKTDFVYHVQNLKEVWKEARSC